MIKSSLFSAKDDITAISVGALFETASVTFVASVMAMLSVPPAFKASAPSLTWPARTFTIEKISAISSWVVVSALTLAYLMDSIFVMTWPTAVSTSSATLLNLVGSIPSPELSAAY